MSNHQLNMSNIDKILFRIIAPIIVFTGIAFILYFVIIWLAILVFHSSLPQPMDRPPPHEPTIIKSPALFSDYLEGISGDAPHLSYDGRIVKTLCIATTYQYPERRGLRYSEYIEGWLSNEFGKAFMIFFGVEDQYIGAIEAGDREVNPEPLTWGQCADLGRH